MSDLNRSHGKMPHFVSIPLFGFTLVIAWVHFSHKTEKFRF